VPVRWTKNETWEEQKVETLMRELYENDWDLHLAVSPLNPEAGAQYCLYDRNTPILWKIGKTPQFLETLKD